MKKSIFALVFVNGLLLFSFGILLSHYFLNSGSARSVQTLDLIVGINTIMVTIAIALAVYKVVSAKNVKEVVEEESLEIQRRIERNIKIIKEDAENSILDIENKLDKIQNARYEVLTNSIESLIVITQEMAEKISIELNISHKAPIYANMISYTSELTKEIVSSLHMFVLTSSPDPRKRLKGYQRLETLKIDQVKDFFREKIAEEKNESNLLYLSKAI